MINLGVPYSGIKTQLDIINTNEAEAVAMAAGIVLAGGEARVHMQADGYLNTANVHTTLIIPYNINDIMVSVHYRNDCKHHIFASKLAGELWQRLMTTHYRV